MSDVRIAENIYRTEFGFRVYVRGVDPRTGRSRKYPKRFGPEMTLEALEAYRDAAKAAADEDVEPSTGFTADATRYLALENVKEAPAFVTREREIKMWIKVFGTTPREAIDKNAINDALHRLRKGEYSESPYSNSSTNKFRTALMSLWTTLDGKSAANPVKDSVEFEESEMIPRGQSYDLLTRILDAIPDERGIAIDRPTLYRELWTEPATTVSKRYGVSSVYLGRLCTRLDIPRPPRGYWMKAARERPAAPPLRRGINGQAPELLKRIARRGDGKERPRETRDRGFRSR